MRNETARELRRQRQMIDQLNRRLAMTDLPGKVKASETDREKRTVRLVLGTAKDGTEILSPPVRWQEATAGRMKIHSEPDDQEQMVLRSASGTVGIASIALPATYDKDHDSPSKDENLSVFDRGDGARIELGNGQIKFIGKFVMEGPSEFTGDVDITGNINSVGTVTNNGKETGSAHTNFGFPVD